MSSDAPFSPCGRRACPVLDTGCPEGGRGGERSGNPWPMQSAQQSISNAEAASWLLHFCLRPPLSRRASASTSPTRGEVGPSPFRKIVLLGIPPSPLVGEEPAPYLIRGARRAEEGASGVAIPGQCSQHNNRYRMRKLHHGFYISVSARPSPAAQARRPLPQGERWIMKIDCWLVLSVFLPRPDYCATTHRHSRTAVPGNPRFPTTSYTRRQKVGRQDAAHHPLR